MLKLAVIGDPIEHSLSPKVHGEALDAIGIEYEYKKIRVRQGEIEDYIKYARSNGIDGFNVTMPHKVDIIPFLDEIDDEAEVFSSVNTVCVRDGKLYGYSTDATGYRLSIGERGYGFDGSRIVILGAGGVVRTLAQAAAIDGAKSITILNRTERSAEEICKKIRIYASHADFGKLSSREIANRCESADILINATPLGMSGCSGNFEDFDFLDALPKSALISDLIYSPKKTDLLKAAEERGNKTLNGLSMLIYQALAADEYYLGREIDKNKIYKEIKDLI